MSTFVGSEDAHTVTNSSGGNGISDDHANINVVIDCGISGTAGESVDLSTADPEDNAIRASEACQGVLNLAFVHDADSGEKSGAGGRTGDGENCSGELGTGDDTDGSICTSGQGISENKSAGVGLSSVGSDEVQSDSQDTNRTDGCSDVNLEDDVDNSSHESPDSLQKVKKVETSLKKWVTGPNFLIYISHSLSAWGDRMWSFGVGVFLVSIASQDLQLPAVYGLSSGVTIFFLGALVGDWVDSTPRLRAAQASLILQNSFVVVCVAGVYLYLFYQPDIEEGDGRHWLIPVCQGGIIFFAILASLASLARTIAIERDWIVEICGRDKDMLAKTTASLRRIDQATLILAPIATGQIMTFAGLEHGAVFIAGWNVMSVFVEYYLIWKVYDTVPALRAKKTLSRKDKAAALPVQEEEGKLEEDRGDISELQRAEIEMDANSPAEVAMEVKESDVVEVESGTGETLENPAEGKENDVGKKPEASEAKEDERSNKKCRCGERIFSRFITLYRGWRTYVGYSVMLAGLALSCLYMTVLGFDNITVAYAMSQGVSESILGILMGASAVFGILGTFAYPALRRRLGLVRTGIFALSAEVICLVLCVVSVWMHGSPFDPYYLSRSAEAPICENGTLMHALPDTNVSTAVNATGAGIYNVNTGLPPTVTDNSTNDCSAAEDTGPESYLSVGMLMAGIVLARFGLWIADLTITQLFLEEVRETERGIVNGVQSSLNKLMDVFKFVLVVAVPDIETFGFLVIVSFAFICLGWLLYAIFLRKARGHFFHFEKCVNGAANGHSLSQAASPPAQTSPSP